MFNSCATVFIEVMQMPEYVVELRHAIQEATPILQGMSEERSRLRPRPGKWCPREVIGHLIDSASNNHQRFVRAQFQDDLVFSGYEQDAWVSVQRYRDAPWGELIALWGNFNLHIARIMQSVPKDERVRLRARHNLDELALNPVPREQPATLDYFMSEYVAHLKHHLTQIGIRLG
jgi:DinB superfamily